MEFALSRSVIRERTWPLLVDAMLFLVVAAGIYALLAIAHSWLGTVTLKAEIAQSPRALPAYAFYSLVRITVAYIFSLVFALVYGYVAAWGSMWAPRLETVMVALLDILQSIPVLSFLPGVMLAMVALFPSRQLGVELGSIILIFTGQVWNMAFSFYSSLKSIPRELREAAQIYRFSAWQRFIELELPFGVIGLVWNSIVSVAGGWFFLMACEMFVLGKNDFRLPGLGSYLQTAASAGNTAAVLWGLGAMIAVIVLLDQLVWRPAISWSDRFKFEQVEQSKRIASPLLHLFRQSSVFVWLRQRAFLPLWERLTTSGAGPRPAPGAVAENGRSKRVLPVVAGIVMLPALYAMIRAAAVLSGLTSGELVSTVKAAGATLLRVMLSLALSSLWTIPAGVAIGFNAKLARVAQPLAQIAASVPATALFPIVLLVLIRVGGGMGIAAIILMLLGTQWYILFNVIAGATAIPTELREAASVFRFPTRQQWTTLILPGIFPYLITGLITASGGAWNASIVAEYFHFQGKTLTTFGLGAQISSASEAGNLHLLLLSTIVMAVLVVCINRLLWRRLYRLAETRFRLET